MYPLEKMIQLIDPLPLLRDVILFDGSSKLPVPLLNRLLTPGVDAVVRIQSAVGQCRDVLQSYVDTYGSDHTDEIFAPVHSII